MKAAVSLILGAIVLVRSGIGVLAGEAAVVKHSPQSPNSGGKVLITLQAPDLDSVQLEYQVVRPGNYVALKDPAYTRDWTALAMQKSADAHPQFSAEIPASVQTHRTLVRYRIRGRDSSGKAVAYPASGDSQPNYAYFVYDAIPAWKAALDPSSWDPRKNSVVQFPPEAMGQVQTYFLIAKISDVENVTWYQQSFDKQYHYTGTFVADGKVYDHVPFRARGGVWRYSMGKNMWKFNFNKGHHLEAKDDYGNRYRSKWGKLNLRACIQQGDYGRRGEQGMYEAVGFRLFNLAGVDAPRTHWVSLRIIGEKEENPSNQYRGDFWGLYLAIENEDEDFLQEHNLPHGNIYKMMFGQGELTNPNAGESHDQRDVQQFLGGMRSRAQSTEWWRQNVDMPRYYSYRSIVEAIHHYDISDGKNYDFYFNPQAGRWCVIPWDIDLTWGDRMFGGGRDPFYRTLSQPALKLEYQNRLREIRDLLFNADETGRLIDECAAIISRPGALSIVDADRFKWDYHPIMSSRYVMSEKSQKGLFYQAVAAHNFAGMVEQMKEYVNHRAAFIDRSLISDSAIPAKPTVNYSGPAGFPANHLNFKTSAFSGSGFASIQWRIGEIDRGLRAEKPKQSGHYEITPVWTTGELPEFREQVTIPASALVAGNTYRLRCRMKDNIGRWSHWSEPVEFTPSAAKN
jgi:hypothetical protein